MAQKILYIHGIGSVGGAERDLLTMLRVLNRDEWEPHVACPADTPLSNLLAKEDLTLHPLEIRPWRKWYSLFTRRQDLHRLRGLVARIAPALIHVNDIWWVPHTLGAVRGIRLRKPIVAHVRQEIEPQKVRRYGLDSVDRVIAISKQVEQALIDGGVGREAVQTIYSGVPLPNAGKPIADKMAVYRALGLSADAVLLGTVAHLFPRKGHDVMLRALPRIMAEVPTVQYLVIGTGDDAYERALRTLAATLGIADRVHFLGFQEDVQPLLLALSLYVHPARMEGFGIALVEALAAGKAVVATRVGGVPEVVDEGRTGLLVPPEQPEELSAAVLTLLRNDARRTAMGESGMHAARSRFDVKASVAQMELLYQQLMKTGQERA